MTKKIYKLEKPLLNQLNSGKEAFKKDLDKFEEDFVKVGPMVRGISAAEASKRVSNLPNTLKLIANLESI